MKIISILKSWFESSPKKIEQELRQPIILVYTVGKVGSTTIHQNLKKQEVFKDILHSHHLSDYALNYKLPKISLRVKKIQTKIEKNKKIVNYLKSNNHRKLKVITLVREPIIRTISGLIQNWDHHFTDIEQVAPIELKKNIESRGFDRSLNWFDKEFYEYLRFDIYSIPFDKEKGYSIYQFNSIDILCLKLEKLNDIGTKAIKEFLGIEIELINYNKSEDKKEYPIYKYLKNNIKFDKEKLSELYQSKYMQHFYTNDEINEFIKKWKT